MQRPSLRHPTRHGRGMAASVRGAVVRAAATERLWRGIAGRQARMHERKSRFLALGTCRHARPFHLPSNSNNTDHPVLSTQLSPSETCHGHIRPSVRAFGSGSRGRLRRRSQAPAVRAVRTCGAVRCGVCPDRLSQPACHQHQHQQRTNLEFHAAHGDSAPLAVLPAPSNRLRAYDYVRQRPTTAIPQRPAGLVATFSASIPPSRWGTWGFAGEVKRRLVLLFPLWAGFGDRHQRTWRSRVAWW